MKKNKLEENLRDFFLEMVLLEVGVDSVVVFHTRRGLFFKES